MSCSRWATSTATSDIIWKGADGAYTTTTINGTQVATQTTQLPGNTGWTLIGHGDFDGDGHQDLVWRYVDGSYGLWLMNGAQIKKAAVLLQGGTGWDVVTAVK